MGTSRPSVVETNVSQSALSKASLAEVGLNRVFFFGTNQTGNPEAMEVESTPADECKRSSTLPMDVLFAVVNSTSFQVPRLGDAYENPFLIGPLSCP